MIVLVTGRHRPHELLLLAWSVLIGISYLARVPAPQSLAATVPRGIVLLWAGGLALSGIVGLVGCLWRGAVVVGLGLERGALIMSTAVLILIAAAIVSANGQRAVYSAGLTVAWGLANLVRCLQITQDLRQVAAAHKENADG